jgi:NAD(P)-dependent dehydrogenase (short-subunit alcohol dehydrogenase family)
MAEKIILITGVSRGIGAATAILAAEKGYSVCINYLHNKEAAQHIVQEIEVKDGKAIAVGADISKEKEVLKLFTMIDKELGVLTALVNNAGILETQM